MGAERDNSYFFTTTRREQGPDYQILFRNLNKAPGPHMTYVAKASLLFMSFSSIFYVPNTLRGGSHWYHHTCAPRVKWIQFRSCLQRLCAGNGADIPWVEAGKGISCPFRGEGTGILTQTLKRINIVISMMTGCLQVVEKMGSVISIMLGTESRG